MLIGEHPIAMSPLKLLFSQQTGCAEQLLPPIPMMERGEQVSPTRTPAGTTIPRRPSRTATRGLVLVVTVLQHWAEPVLQELGVPDGLFLRATSTGVARRVGGRGGRPRAKRSALVSEGLDSAEAMAAASTATRVVNFMAD